MKSRDRVAGKRDRDIGMEQRCGMGGRRLSDQAKISFSRSGSLTQQARVLIERVSLDVFVRYSAFLESHPAFLREWAELLGAGVRTGGERGGRRAYPTAVQDEFAVGLVASDCLFGQACGVRVKLEDVGCHGSTEGGGAVLRGLRMSSGGWTVAY
jgi:hypothetical protein